jgi:enoyl-CoA hydratase
MSPVVAVEVTFPRPGVMLATLNRPDVLNAMNEQMIGEIGQLCREAEDTPAVRVLVLAGAGRAFSSGLDVAETDRLIHADPAARLAILAGWSRAVTMPSQISKPVVAAVHGHAAGGGLALALAADIRIATPAARFSAAFIRVGFTGADMGVSWFLPRIAGLGHAADLMMTGRAVGAAEAERMGLVNQIAGEDELLGAAYAFADALIANSAVSIALTKGALHASVGAPALQAALDLENRNQALITGTEAAREALASFQRRRSQQGAGEGS